MEAVDEEGLQHLAEAGVGDVLVGVAGVVSEGWGGLGGLGGDVESIVYWQVAGHGDLPGFDVECYADEVAEREGGELDAAAGFDRDAVQVIGELGVDGFDGGDFEGGTSCFGGNGGDLRECLRVKEPRGIRRL